MVGGCGKVEVKRQKEESRRGSQSEIRRRYSYGAKENFENMCFCETNPPFWRMKSYGISILSETYVVCRAFLQVGSFSKTNPPGRGFRGGFVEK